MHIIGKFHRDFAVRLHIGEIRKRVSSHIARAIGKYNMQITPFFLWGIDWHQCRNRNAGFDRQNIDDCFAFGISTAKWQFPGFQCVNHAICGEEQQGGMCVCHKHVGNKVLIFCGHTLKSFAATRLCAELFKGGAFDITLIGNGYDHLFALNQILIIKITRPFGDFSTTRNGKFLFHFTKLIRNDRHNPFAGP